MAYHWGSLAVQDRVGVRELAEHVGRSIGPDVRGAAALFLARQPHLVVGAADGTGRLWASLLTAAPGFVRATGPDRIRVEGGLPQGDPLAGALATVGTRVGTISLDPRTRRRLRLNGTLDAVTPGGFAVAAERVFGNCPKYLQKREPLELVAEGAGVV
ncbi:pyridoxamine 5'-phosphate oxidase family protein, partial [Streptomyces goshikiensis]